MIQLLYRSGLVGITFIVVWAMRLQVISHFVLKRLRRNYQYDLYTLN